MGARGISLEEAVKFHGHLGPYLVLGILAGELALKKLNCKKYFGLTIKVWGVNKKPKSCLIDGLQLSTGATYGKGNIHKFKGLLLKIEFRNITNKKIITLKLKQSLINILSVLISHADSESFARELYKVNPLNLFEFAIKQ